MRQEKDLILIEKFKSGDRKAYEGLYRAYRGAILNYLYRMTNDRDLAEELTQEVFIKVFMNIDKYRPIGSFSSWVYAIARNRAKNAFRSLSRKRNVSMETGIGGESGLTLGDVIKGKALDAGEIAQKGEARDQIESILNAMPVKYKEPIVLCMMQGMSYEEAAKIVKCSRAAVAIRLYRAKKIFISLMGNIRQ